MGEYKVRYVKVVLYDFLRPYKWQKFFNEIELDIFNENQHYLEKAMAPHSSTLTWKIPWTEEPGRMQSMGLQRVGHD